MEVDINLLEEFKNLQKEDSEFTRHCTRIAQGKY